MKDIIIQAIEEIETSKKNKRELIKEKQWKLEQKKDKLKKDKDSLISYWENGNDLSRCNYNKPGYLNILLACYEKLLDKEEESLREIFDTYKPLLVCEYGEPGTTASNNTRYSSYFNDLLILKKEIFSLEREIQELKSSENEQDNLIAQLQSLIIENKQEEDIFSETESVELIEQTNI